MEDPLVHADVILVLSGRLPERAVEAARVYKAGYADQVWISPPVSPVDDLKAMNIAYLGEDFYNEKVLMAQGVPPDAIRILDRPDANTEEEVRQIGGGSPRPGLPLRDHCHFQAAYAPGTHDLEKTGRR